MWKLEMLLILVSFSVGGVIVGYFLRNFISQRKRAKLELEVERMKFDAEKESTEIIESAKSEKNKIIEEGIKEIQKKQTQNDEERKILFEKENSLEKIKNELDKKKEIYQKKEREQIKELERISGLSEDQARDMVLKKIQEEYQEDLFLASSKLDNENRKNLEEKAKSIMVQAIQKYSGEVNNSLISTIVKIDSDDEKGKIIGKDGRNIRTFERLTGVQLIIDEGPEVVTISSFDPIRREIASRVLKRLLEDGIVQPAKIEEYYENAVSEVIEIIREKGEEAAKEAGVYNLNPELLEILGRLHFRTSYGQNVLKHSLEMVHIAGVIAEELNLNVSVVKAAALLHDIGKAVDFETEGTHVEIGRRILKQYNVNEEIIKAMQSHHKEYPNQNLESFLIDAADAISAARPGARSDSAEMYIKKLEGLERITAEFDGVQEAYALSAGREVRVFVKPNEVNDFVAKKMARQIALRIEEELKYPGEIKVAVIREKRAITFAR